jgi:hypothetical protein
MSSLSLFKPIVELPPKVLLWVSGPVLTGLFLYMLLKGYGTVLTALLPLALLGCLLVYNRVAAMLATIAYLFLVGDLRRIRDLAFPHPSLDPLLLVGPAIAVILALPVIIKAKSQDPLSKAILFLTLVMTAEIFNPSQGGLGVGVGGAFFYLVPVFWFWIGREYGTTAVLEAFLYRVILPLAIAAALMGLYQNFIGFLPYQQLWIDANINTFVILRMGNGSRSFGFSVAPSEYASLVQIGAIGVVAAYMAGRKAWILALPILIAALILASGRSVIVKMVFALAFTWVARNRKDFGAMAIIRLIVIMMVGLIAVSVIASRFAGGAQGYGPQSATSAAIAHEAGGLANPFDKKKSTVGLHSQYVLGGFLEGFKYPFGHGLGSTTAATGKLGTSKVMFTEIDLSDLFIALGLPGGILYLYCVFQALRSALLFVRGAPKVISLPTLAILGGGIGIWLVTSQYSTSAMYLFMIGCLTHSESGAVKVKQRIAAPTVEPLSRAVA